MPNPISNFFRKHFAFSSQEIRGLYLFLPLTILIIFLPQFIKGLLFDAKNEDLADKALLESWREETLAKISNDTLSVAKIEVGHFNPNKLTTKEWVDLGFKEDVALRILNYQTKGGTFKEKSDLLKIYGINERLVREYEPYMIIPREEKKQYVLQPVAEYATPKKDFVKFELNRADTAQLMTINGIGPYWSKRIVKYRTLLGGFRSVDQLYEIYGMERSLADLVSAHTFFESVALSKININQDSVQALTRHPYISYKTADAIIKYRKQHGDFSQVNEIQKIASISDSVFQKISPYLKVSE